MKNSSSTKQHEKPSRSRFGRTFLANAVLFIVLQLCMNQHLINALQLRYGETGERIQTFKRDTSGFDQQSELTSLGSMGLKMNPRTRLHSGRKSRSRLARLRRKRYAPDSRLYDQELTLSLPQISRFCKLTHENMTLDVVYECRASSRWLDGDLMSENLGHISSNSSGQLRNAGTADNRWSLTRSSLLRYDITTIQNATRQWTVPGYVTVLRLWKQNIAVIKANAFLDLRESLRNLRLDHNMISYTSKRAFAGLSQLRELDLSNNRIQTLPSCVFGSLVRLKFLKLQHNEIEFVGQRSLAGLQSLVQLDLSSNAIEDIHEDGFQHLSPTRTVVINLNKNRLTVPRKGWLMIERDRRPDACPSIYGGIVRKTPSAHGIREDFKATTDAGNLTAAAETTSNQTDVSRTLVFDDATKDVVATRIIWGSDNLWQCDCSSFSDTADFVKAFIVRRKYSFEKDTSTGDVDSSRCETTRNCTVISKIRYRTNLDIVMPCVGSAFNLDLGVPFEVASDLHDKCCISPDDEAQQQPLTSSDSCLFLEELVKNNSANGTENIAESFGLTENQVTVIGILIVVTFPVLLTLCPDCNKPMVPVHDNGIGVLNNQNSNNNNNNSNNVDSSQDGLSSKFDSRSNVGETCCYGGKHHTKQNTTATDSRTSACVVKTHIHAIACPATSGKT